MRGAIEHAGANNPLHHLHVWATEQRLLLGQRATDGAPGLRRRFGHRKPLSDENERIVMPRAAPRPEGRAQCEITPRARRRALAARWRALAARRPRRRRRHAHAAGASAPARPRGAARARAGAGTGPRPTRTSLNSP
ncbi:MAG TPA: hypothetical protein VFS43_01360 [Polyangiaceae bacterium]|nr:hypothetical protein [Polyangiaceae bacterium]